MKDFSPAPTREEFAKMFDMAPILICAAAPDGRFLFVNAEWERVLGYSKAELLRSGYVPLIHPDDIGPTRAEVARQLAGSSTANFINRYRHRNGGYRVLEWQSTPSLDGVLYAAARDVTEARETQERLEVSEARLAEAQTVARLGSWETDLATLNVFWSQEIYRIFGVEPAAFSPTHQGFLEFVHPDDRLAVDAAFKAAIEAPTALNSIEHRIVTAAGALKHIEERWQVFRDDGGRPLRAVGTCQDITDRKRTAELMAKAQKLESLGTLAGGIAHDFNNLLAAIQGNIALIKAESSPTAKVRVLFEEAENACGVAAGVARQLLTFAKGGKPSARACEMKSLLKKSAEFAARGLQARCVCEFDRFPLAARVDPVQTAQVIHNLVLNADQAMPEGGTVAIRAAAVELEPGRVPDLPAGRYVRVEVEDQGKGIAPQHIPRLFDPFFSTKEEGRGLGLSVCHSIMTRHGGAIRLDSRPGKGCVVTLYFPAAEAPPEPASEETPRSAHRPGRVLVMDDDPAVASLFKRTLERLGYQAETASDGEAAITAYSRGLSSGSPFIAVILDLTIQGGMGGLEALAGLRRLDPAVRAVVSSGYSEDPVMADSPSHGFCASLKKPFKLEELSEALLKALDAG